MKRIVEGAAFVGLFTIMAIVAAAQAAVTGVSRRIRSRSFE